MERSKQLSLLRNLVGKPSVSDVSDEILGFYLDNAQEIICELRNSNEVESQYSTVQIKMAIEMYSKMGAEGQTSHTENGISRMYEKADLSPSLMSQITPVVRTPFSKVRVV